jgi:hypothetical protein
MTEAMERWLAACPDLAGDPGRGMREAGLMAPAPDYRAIARGKATLVERTGLLGMSIVWGGPQLVFRHFLSFGSEAQRSEWSGRALAVAISEPDVGAHPKRLTTVAKPVAGGFEIIGRKAWVSNGASADAIIVFAITEEAAGRKRYSAFLVPRATVGLTLTEMPGFHALRPSRHCLLTLDGCFVPASAMIGEDGSAYDRMAKPFRDVEDAVGTYATLGALRHALHLFAGSQQAEALGAIAALVAVFGTGAEAVVSALDTGSFREGNAVLVGLRILAVDITARLRVLAAEGDRTALASCLADLEATFAVAAGPRLARQTQLGEALIRGQY